MSDEEVRRLKEYIDQLRENHDQERRENAFIRSNQQARIAELEKRKSITANSPIAQFLFAERMIARERKDFERADMIRDLLKGEGISLADGKII